MNKHHPIRDAEIRVFQQIGGSSVIGRFFPYSVYPIFFTGNGEQEVREKMQQFVDETVEKHEAAFIARAEAIEKARIARAAKKDTTA